MATKEIDYEAAFNTLSKHLEESSEKCILVCKTHRETRQLIPIFETLGALGPRVLAEHIK